MCGVTQKYSIKNEFIVEVGVADISGKVTIEMVYKSQIGHSFLSIPEYFKIFHNSQVKMYSIALTVTASPEFTGHVVMYSGDI